MIFLERDLNPQINAPNGLFGLKLLYIETDMCELGLVKLIFNIIIFMVYLLILLLQYRDSYKFSK